MTALTLLSLLGLSASAASAGASAPAPTTAEARATRYLHRLSVETGRAVVAPSTPIPSFSRQTGLPCTACHSTFPQLNAFGRLFKMNGYTLAAQQTIQVQDSGKAASLRLDLVPPVSAMVISSLTSIRRSVPGQQNRSTGFPQELGLFIGEAITPRLGTFLQLTYDPAEGGVSIDNADIRFANQTSVGSVGLLYGVTLNNSPTVQDVWNSTPVWGYPFTGSDVAPAPMAGTLIDGGLGQRVAGLGAYGLWNSLLYTEFSVYRSAFQGGPDPVDASAEDAIHGVAPYWRVAIQRRVGRQQLMIGTYGLHARLVPAGFAGPYDRYTDIALDAQLDRPMHGGGSLTAHATWIHESRRLTATALAGGAERARNTLQTARVDATWYPRRRVGGSLGYFTTWGDRDPLLYPTGDFSGSATGSPDSSGLVAQLSFMPWLNTRLGVQYVAYTRFNGARRDYDGSGRNASDNDALYLMSWLVF